MGIFNWQSIKGKDSLNKNNLPRHVGIIMDGNRRFAKNKGLPSFAGHIAGAEKLEEIIRLAVEVGITELTVWAFSTDNWNRSTEEVKQLMNLTLQKLIQKIGTQELADNNIAIYFIGRLKQLNNKIQLEINKLISQNPKSPKLQLNIALNYGGREEILDACLRLQDKKGKITIKNMQSVFENSLYKPSMLPVDLVIRTGGELRTSGFLPYQALLAEYYFSPKMWPDFSRLDFLEAISDYQRRQRRFGK